jgi:hypothetical protein
MSHIFCAIASREAREDITGSAPTHSIYVLIEHPYTWAAKEFESKMIPPNLKAWIETINQSKLPIRFLLFRGESSRPPRTRVIIFHQPAGQIRGYCKRELEVETIDQVMPLLQHALRKLELGIDCGNAARDIFVCTHGSHDRCCARFGYPFYRQACTIVQKMNARSLDPVRIWQVSHIGGHRFAPTLVTFPDGRYYGALDEAAFSAIVQRVGEIQCLQQVYRGWGILPQPIQAMEKEIILQQGWKWFDYHVSYQILSSDSEAQSMQVELQAKKLGESPLIYTAKIAVDEAKTQDLLSSCGGDRLTQPIKYKVENLHLVSQ